MNRCLIPLLYGSLLTGCAVGPDYEPPKTDAPSHWSEAAVGQQRGGTHHHLSAWWKTFRDPVLNRLIAEAIHSNLDLKQAAARIRDARAQQTVAIAAILPSASAHSNLSRRSNNFAASTIGGGASGGGGFAFGNQIINIFQAGFDTQWELDVFGGIRRGIEAAEATVDAEVENRRDVMVSLLGEVARLYIEVRSSQQLIAVTQDKLVTQRDTLALTEARQQAGLASMLEVAQQRSQLAGTESQLPLYETAMKQAVHALGVLLGKQPDAYGPLLTPPGGVPMTATAVAAELPSELLRRRPDIRRAERRVAVANAQIGVATAELYPKFNLATFLGIQNMRLTDISPLGKSWSAAASISMPIFNWGKLQANISSKEAQKEVALLDYQATVLNAFQEVEDSLVAYAQEQARLAALAKSVEASKLAVELANERYLKGLVDFLDVLETQRALFQAQSTLVASQTRVSENLVALYKALGGGWE